MFKISVSKAKTFESCKLKFKYNYILKLPQKEFTFFAYGKMLHMILEDFHRELMKNPTINKSEFMGKCFKEAKDKYKEKLPKNDMKEAYKTIDEYLQILAAESNPPTILNVESEFNVDINDGEVTLIGMIDRVQKDLDGMLHVIDYKSSKNMKYYENDFFQMKIYAYVMMLEDPNLMDIRCSYQFLRHSFCYITKEFHRNDVMKMKDVIVEYVRNMQSEKEFPSNASFLCNYCGFLDVCSDGKKALLPKIIKSGKTSWT